MPKSEYGTYEKSPSILKTRKIQTNIYTTYNIQQIIAHIQISKDRLNPLRDGPTFGQSVPIEVAIFCSGRNVETKPLD